MKSKMIKKEEEERVKGHRSRWEIAELLGKCHLLNNNSCFDFFRC